MTSLLQLDHVGAGYGALQALWDVSLHVEPGEVVALLGPNGAGKSTTIRAVVGLATMFGGEVFLDGEEVSSMSYHRRLSRRLAWVPEGRSLFDDLSVRDNLYLSSRQAGTSDDFDEHLASAIDLFPVIKDKLHVPAAKLSGGQQQMVAIARGLVRAPQLILLDEPSLGLAPLVTHELRRAIEGLARLGVSILVAEQNTQWLKGMSGRVYFLQGGRIVEEGSSALMDDPDLVRQVYLGLDPHEERA